ncbi:hypothetical protein [Arthrobacter agilis]|uniref:hypothetical protein n=1 Tax=Arthrobacter agilis TaxID=37921 RepID=UPI0027D790D7|nr:hypothetical protein [Arthrobacter agilis]
MQQEVDLPGTVKVITDLGSVDQAEWDALILNSAYQKADMSNVFSISYSRVAEHLHIFKVLPEGHYANHGVLDRVSGLNSAEDDVTLTLRWKIPGQEISIQQGFCQELRTSLTEAAESRDTQSGLIIDGELPVGVVVDSFAIGPQGVILAGTITAPKRGEVWFVPSEVRTLGPWINAAFASWRRLEPKKFPGVPDWWASPEWYSAAESAIALRLVEENETFERAKAKFEAARVQLESELDKAREEAAAGSRQLLRGQDDALQDAVRDALEDLGFGVRDMDLEWEDKERREDFRITDPDDPQWLVLGDATGVSGNAKGGKLTVLQGYVTKYVFEEKPDIIPGMWYLLNREIDKDPNVRSTILRTDEIEPFAAQQGLILDTTALYVLLRHAHDLPEDKPAIRQFLRMSIGLVALPNATAWIKARTSVAIASE